MRIAMIGGTGFLGFFTCRELLRRGHAVTAVGLSLPAAGEMPDGARVLVLDTQSCGVAALVTLLQSHDCVIHAAGADGRAAFEVPAIDGFRAANVAPLVDLVTAMKHTACKRLVIFGSYYTALARIFPAMGFLDGNAYPQSRVEQAERAFALAGEHISVAVLELPCIFGAAPGRGTLWQFYMDHVTRHDPDVPVPAGGSACVTAQQVAMAAAGACERSEGHRSYPIGGKNLRYAEIYAFFARAMGLSRSFVRRSPDMALAEAKKQCERLAEAGIGTGYDPLAVARWQEQLLYLDPAPAMQALGFGPADIAAAIAETVRATRRHGGQGPASASTSPG